MVNGSFMHARSAFTEKERGNTKILIQEQEDDYRQGESRKGGIFWLRWDEGQNRKKRRRENVGTQLDLEAKKNCKKQSLRRISESGRLASLPFPSRSTRHRESSHYPLRPISSADEDERKHPLLSRINEWTCGSNSLSQSIRYEGENALRMIAIDARRSVLSGEVPKSYF